jgi:hypothetical protein
LPNFFCAFWQIYQCQAHSYAATIKYSSQIAALPQKNNADITLFKKLTSALPLFIVCLENYFPSAAR